MDILIGFFQSVNIHKNGNEIKTNKKITKKENL